MVPLLPYILLDTSQQLTIVDAHALEQRDEIIRAESAVWTAVLLTATRQGFGEEFLAGIRCIASAALVGVTTNVTVGVTDVVQVFGFELVCGDYFQ